MKPQVSQHFGESCQVTEGGVTEPGLQAGSPPFIALTCNAVSRAGQVGHIPGTSAYVRLKALSSASMAPRPRPSASGKR